MGIRIFVVISKGQITQLHVKTIFARVIRTGFAPAIAAPIAERENNTVELRIIGDNGAAFAHSEVVGRVKAIRADMPNGAGFFPFPLRT